MYAQQGIEKFGKLVSDCFDVVYKSSSDCMVGVIEGTSETRIVAELAVLKEL